MRGEQEIRRTIEQEEEPKLGFLDKEDKEMLEEAGPKLREIIEQAQKKERPFRTFIYLTRGARLLSRFVKGLTEDLTEKQKSEIRYIQVSAVAGKKEKKLIFERIAEVAKTTKPPYLIIDDYVTTRHLTFNTIMQGFKKSGIEESNITFFAFIAQSKESGGWGEEEEIEIPSEFYEKLGMRIGAQDKYGSSTGFYFNKEVLKLKGVKKDTESKYEKVSEEGNRFALRNIRKELYSAGKEITEKGKEEF